MKFLVLVFFIVSLHSTLAQSKKGFDLRNASIPVDEIKDGGPPKDGIPSIDQPQFTKAAAQDLDSRVLGVVVNGIAKAYPIAIMNYHEIVNDRFGEQPVVVTYCPLCGSGIAFDAEVDGEKRTFGVSGLLYNSDVLLYDRQTNSLWSQLMMEAIGGPMVGEKLTMVPTINTSLKEWMNKYPNTLLLSEETGYQRDYTLNPYPGYDSSTQLYFDVEERDDRFHPKEMVIGLEIDGQFKAYPLSELKKMQQTKIKVQFQKKDLTITYNPDSQSAEISDADGNVLPTLSTFWFAWYAFHPDTEVFQTK